MKIKTAAATGLAFAVLALAGCATPAPAPDSTADATSACSMDDSTGLTTMALTDALIPGAGTADDLGAAALGTAALTGDAPLYVSTSDRTYDLAGVLPAAMPWAPETAVPAIVVRQDDTCGMTEVLIPSRAALPSEADSPSASATAWIPDSALAGFIEPAPRTVTVDLRDSSVSVTNRAGEVLLAVPGVGIGREGEETPSGVGYVVSEFVDDRQGAGQPILLTSLHSTVSDSYSGNAGEIGIHASEEVGGAVSAGCIRLRPADQALLTDIVSPGDVVRIIAAN
ncbi:MULTISPECIES: L,D-transpeptidase [unclassified Pseudoclavibacter]|uniref:L,D-transpeptidase n=1 Tax=unclassified Pseudoclavibacter TaxID=2615177 RepID=UPI001BAD8CA2|nr:L,D-transpeptidase [Pseudoclavibacter sp. Marseille-Q4354]MBS3180042.1 L,D-transpeptidase [Pseudoclavibacter sp. Marseille-Q4354]